MRFAYKALKPGGEILEGDLAAETREAALEKLRGRGLVPLEISAARKAARPRASARPSRRKVTARDLMLFTRELAVLLGARVPLARALETLDGMITQGPLRGVPGRLVEDIRGGAPLEQALARHPQVFPPFYTGMVRAGEAGGALAPMLERLAAMLERSDALDQTVRSALVYPLIVLVVTALSLVVLMVFVVPEFRPIFDQAGGELPATTRAVLAVSDFTIAHGWTVPPGLLVLWLALRRMGMSAGGRLALHRWLLRAPLAGGLIRRIETARFARSLGTLRANGVALIEAIGIAAGTLSNSAMAGAARAMAGPVAEGRGLSAPMRESGVFPPLAVQLVEIGEESGQLAAMLMQVADVFDREASRGVERALGLLAPLVTILLGLVVALVIGSILTAILGSYDVVA